MSESFMIPVYMGKFGVVALGDQIFRVEIL